MAERITLIGSGAMGTMCALVLAEKGLDVTIWGRSKQHIDQITSARENRRYLPGFTLPENIYLTSDSAQACRGASLFINATPTQYIRAVFSQLARDMPDNAQIVSTAKGIEQDTLLLPTQIICDVLKEAQVDHGQDGHATCAVAALSGPSIALEIANHLPATLCAASKNNDLASHTQQLFTTSYLRTYASSDPVGVELAGATKNVIALAAGMLDGLKAGVNAKSALLARGLAEIARLGAMMGAKQETFFGVAGVGDLATTCFSPTGRNRSCGELLGQGVSLEAAQKKIPGIVEGVATTGAAVKLAEKYQVDMPITRAVHRVLFNNVKPAQAIAQLMSRQPQQSERIGQDS